MNLKDDFFKVIDSTVQPDQIEYTVEFDASHFIYKAHFPGNPVTPGVCIIQMVKELAGDHLQSSFFLEKVSNVKFLNVINPQENKTVSVTLVLEKDNGDKCKVTASVYKDDTTFSKLSLILSDTGKQNMAGKMAQMKVCVIIPTYNNAQTVGAVITSVLDQTSSLIVVNDGSTDETARVLESFGDGITVLSYPENKGKGYALRKGFEYALEKGFKYAITLDSDGQHYASDIPAFINALEHHPHTLITGSRNLNHDHMPGKNTFANKFSNFWFTVQTAKRLPDTQTGYRLYPLPEIRNMRLFTSRYETELEILVRSVWRGIPVINIPVNVHYPPEGERISHYRPFTDFMRIFLLNTVLTFMAVFYGYPARLVRHLRKAGKR